MSEANSTDLFAHRSAVWYTSRMANVHSSFLILDTLVEKAQDLDDLYMRCLDENPGAHVEKPHDAQAVDNLLQALAGFILAANRAVSAIATYASGQYDDRGDF